MSSISHVLVTGATGFIGAHIVDQLLERGIKVRGTTRSPAKGQQMKAARPQYSDKLDFIQVADFSGEVDFRSAVESVDAVIHTASPLTYETTSNERELLLPALTGVRAILTACAATPSVRRLILTSSFASVIDTSTPQGPGFTYTATHWNPLTYAEAIDPSTPAVVAYRGSKKFAELEAWNFVEREKPGFDLVTFCPPMTFGPVRHPVASPEALNESNARLWDVAAGKPLPEARVPVWIDARDLAKAHVEAVFRVEVGGKRYVPAAPEKFSYAVAARVLRERMPEARGKVADVGNVAAPESYDLDGRAVSEDLGVTYRAFSETLVDLFEGLDELGMKPWS